VIFLSVAARHLTQIQFCASLNLALSLSGQELVTEDELMTQVRRHGLEQIEQVKLAYMEGDGTISVIGIGATDADSERRRAT
jgi:hypothetical protein